MYENKIEQNNHLINIKKINHETFTYILKIYIQKTRKVRSYLFDKYILQKDIFSF